MVSCLLVSCIAGTAMRAGSMASIMSGMSSVSDVSACIDSGVMQTANVKMGMGMYMSAISMTVAHQAGDEKEAKAQ